MVTLVKQLIDHQTTAYDPAELEDRYEMRLRTLIDAKLRGAKVSMSANLRSLIVHNVVDLMIALKKSLAQEAAPKKAAMANCPGNADAFRGSSRCHPGQSLV